MTLTELLAHIARILTTTWTAEPEPHTLATPDRDAYAQMLIRLWVELYMEDNQPARIRPVTPTPAR